MRTLLIFLFIGIVFTLTQSTNGAPAKSVSSESDEDDGVDTKISISDPIRNSNDQSDENEEDDNVETEVKTNFKSISDSDEESDENDETTTQSKFVAIENNESDQTSEEKMEADEAFELIPKFEKPDSYNIQQDLDDDADD